MKTFIAPVVALGLGLLSSPTLASGDVVNGHAASPAEMQLLVSYGAQPSNWVIDGYGISPAVQKANASAANCNKQTCRHVLDVLLCG